MSPSTTPPSPKPAQTQSSPTSPPSLFVSTMPNSLAEQIAHVGRHYTAIIEELRRQVAAKGVEDGQGRGGPAVAAADARCGHAELGGAGIYAGKMETAEMEADRVEMDCVGERQMDYVHGSEAKMSKTMMMGTSRMSRTIETQLAEVCARVEKLESTSDATEKKRVHDRHKRKQQRRKEKASRVQRKIDKYRTRLAMLALTYRHSATTSLSSSSPAGPSTSTGTATETSTSTTPSTSSSTPSTPTPPPTKHAPPLPNLRHIWKFEILFHHHPAGFLYLQDLPAARRAAIFKHVPGLNRLFDANGMRRLKGCGVEEGVWIGESVEPPGGYCGMRGRDTGGSGEEGESRGSFCAHRWCGRRRMACAPVVFTNAYGMEGKDGMQVEMMGQWKRLSFGVWSGDGIF